MLPFTHLRIAKLFAIGLVLIGSSDLHAKDAIQVRIDPLVQPYLDNEIVMGMSIGVLQGGKTTVLGYGRLSEKDQHQPDGDTIYEIGSISKVFTGLLLADAVMQGRVRLDQPAGGLLPPGAKMPTHKKRPVTLQDLATHVSGLPRLPDQFTPADWSNPYADYTGKQLVAFLNRHKLTRAPGEKFEYSNLGMGLLGQMLAFEAKSSYKKLLQERIAAPLGMHDTTIALDKQQRSRLAPPHTADNQPGSSWDFLAIAGAGGIRSTTNDMLRLAKSLLSPPDNQLGEAIELAWKVHQEPLVKEDFAIGLAWHVARDGSTRWHNGQTGGYHTMMLVSRNFDSAVVLLANTATGEVDQLAQDIMRMLAGAKVEPRSFEQSIEVSAQVMQRYVGKYELAPGLVFTVTLQDNQLMVQLTGQPALPIHARTETEWFLKIVQATITFQVDDKGECESLELFQNGVRQKAKRLK